MCEPPFRREEERRLHELEQKARSDDACMTDDEAAELAFISQRYQQFIEEGQQRLRDGANSSPSSSHPVANTMADSFSKAGKAAYFWTSLMATAVPGYLGRKAGVTSAFLHWNLIVDHLLLGALPVVTQVGNSGNHLVVLKEQLDARGEALGMVVACLEEEEMNGFGINVIQFAREADWREYVNPNLRYVRLAMEDTTARVPFEDVAKVVDEMHQCAYHQKMTVYVHCKAGKGRSWMVVMCYLVSYGGMSYDEAKALVERRREHVNPSIAQQCFAREFPLRFAKWRSLQSTGPANPLASTSVVPPS